MIKDRKIKENEMKLKTRRMEWDNLIKQLDSIKDEDPLCIEKSVNIKSRLEVLWAEIRELKKQ